MKRPVASPYRKKKHFLELEMEKNLAEEQGMAKVEVKPEIQHSGTIGNFEKKLLFF